MPLTTLTFGCRLNASESRVMRERAAAAGLEDAVLVNTCAVTAEAVRQARQAIRKARRENPDKRIVVAGCAAQIAPASFAAMPEVDCVLGNAEKLTAEAYRGIPRPVSGGVGGTEPTPQDVVIARLDPAIQPASAAPDAEGNGMDARIKSAHDDGADGAPGDATLRSPYPEAPARRRRGGLEGRGLSLAHQQKVRVADIFAVTETAPHLLDGFVAASADDGGAEQQRARAFLEVQNGCDHRCTFCIIPYGRGNSRSVPMGAVVESARRLVAAGVAEIVLTGVDITSYGADLPGRPRLGALVRAILRHVPELKRLRISSIDSVEADPALVAAIAEEERLMPHLHLSLQSGDDMILKRMKRRHSRADAIRFCDAIREARPEIVLGADLIAGFPTETDAMFENTLSLIEACGLSLLHVFPFSPREGTPAARMPQLERHLVQARARTLRQAGHGAYVRRLGAEAGKRRNILVEKPGFGRTEHYLPATIHAGRPGEIVSARIAAAGDNALIAQGIKEAA
jgi:threonylcarbamoyladenosine tRNA methylthiotransferase MtaB